MCGVELLRRKVGISVEVRWNWWMNCQVVPGSENAAHYSSERSHRSDSRSSPSLLFD